jgi:glutathione synthase/RimK-type ligase-like ATP-grasp enzyme
MKPTLPIFGRNNDIVSLKRKSATPAIKASQTIAFITDSWTHNEDDTLFPMALHYAQSSDHGALDVYIIDRAVMDNQYFFDTPDAEKYVHAFRVQDEYHFDTAVQYCVNKELLEPLPLSDIDIIYMMMDQPVEDSFMHAIGRAFGHAEILNNPVSACLIGNKAYLDTLYRSNEHVRPFMPATRHCRSVVEIDLFALENGGEIILKTLKGYGGAGVKRYGGTSGDSDIKNRHELADFLRQEGGSCIAMQRLHHPMQEDNRILVVNGEIRGVLKRTAAEGAFLCNMCAGGSAAIGEASADEIALIEALKPTLLKHGLHFVGIDTLRHIDENGKERRLLSEINTLNTGGLSFMNDLTDQPILQEVADELITQMIKEQPCLAHEDISEEIPPLKITA